MPISLNEKRSGDYSQHGESGVIDAVFEAIGIESHTCVEFGAYDLKALSNVYQLWTNGWRALLDPRRSRTLHQDPFRLSLASSVWRTACTDCESVCLREWRTQPRQYPGGV